MFVANQPRSLAGNLPSLEIERVAIGFVGGLVELFGDVAVIVEIEKLAVVRNIAPDEILSLRVLGWPLRPQTAGIEPLDRGVADFGLEALGVDHDDIRIRIALGFGVGAEVTFGCQLFLQALGLVSVRPDPN